MAIATGMAIAMGVMAATSAAGAVAKSKAASKAAEQQQAGAKEASAISQQGMKTSQNVWAPYINSGAGAMGTLSRLTTPGGGARFASPGPPNAMGAAVPKTYGNAAYDEIGTYFKNQTGKDPTQAQVSQWGTNLDDNYRKNIQGAIAATPEARLYAERGGAAGPYPMAAGGDMMVNQPTLFLAGEAGPERATFSGAQPQMGPPPGGMPPGMGRPPIGVPPGMGRPPQTVGQARPSDPNGDIMQTLMAKYGARPGPPPGMGQRPMPPPPMGGPQGPPPPMGTFGRMGGPPPQMGPRPPQPPMPPPGYGPQ